MVGGFLVGGHSQWLAGGRGRLKHSDQLALGQYMAAHCLRDGDNVPARIPMRTPVPADFFMTRLAWDRYAQTQVDSFEESSLAVVDRSRARHAID